jgi:hypothetical protein
MTQPTPATPPAANGSTSSPLVRASIWVAIGALIAAAIVSVVWVLVGNQNGLIGRAFLTIFLLAAFAGVSILEARLSSRRPVWFVLVSMTVWVVTLLIGAIFIWMPAGSAQSGYDDPYGSGSNPLVPSYDGVDPLLGAQRTFSFFLVVLILQLAVLHVRLYVKAWLRFRTSFTTVTSLATIALVGILAVLLVIPLVLQEFLRFHDIYWRLTVAVAILAAVGTALVPLVTVLFAPRTPKPLVAGPPPGWPTYADRVTPLPPLPNGTPDWNAYYTGRPSFPAPGSAPAAAPAPAPAAPVAAPTGDPTLPPRPPLPPQTPTA